MATTTMIPVGQALAEVEAVLAQVDPARRGVSAATRLEWVRLARRVKTKVDAMSAVLTAEAYSANAAQKAAGTPMTSWLAIGEPLSRREAAAVVGRAKFLAEHPRVGEAAAAGRLGEGQERSISKVLSTLKPQLDAEQQVAAERMLVDLAGHLDSDQLSEAAPRVLAEVAPSSADDRLEAILQRRAEAAHIQRSLRWYRNQGSLQFAGSLPTPEGELLVGLVNANVEAIRRTAIESRDPLAQTITPEQRRADALVALLHSNQRSGVNRGKPVNGRHPTTRSHPHIRGGAIVHPPVGNQQNAASAVGEALVGASNDRKAVIGASADGEAAAGVAVGAPAVVEAAVGASTVEAVAVGASTVGEAVAGASTRVLVTLDYHQLKAGAAGAGVIGPGELLSAGQLRRLCCQAELVPVVLGTESEVLDVGRAARLATPAIRTALIVRDKRCAFPGCDVRPESCEAHHIVPWWGHGPTALSNLVLLCPHHHGMIEPAKHATRDQWQVRLDAHELPEFIPPRRLDPQRKPVNNRTSTPRVPSTVPTRSPGDPPG